LEIFLRISLVGEWGGEGLTLEPLAVVQILKWLFPFLWKMQLAASSRKWKYLDGRIVAVVAALEQNLEQLRKHALVVVALGK
jgi:hypothetical protein